MSAWRGCPLACVLSLWAGVLLAQEEAGDDTPRVIEEITVTATKREVALLDTAMSVGVLTGAIDDYQALTRLGLGDHQARQNPPRQHQDRQRDRADPEALAPEPSQVFALDDAPNAGDPHPVPP